MREALGFVRRDRVLLVTFVVMAIVSTFAFNYGVSLPKLADVRWGGEGNFGLVLSVTSIGSLVGSLLTARLSWVSTRWYLGNIVLLGVAGIGMAWSPNLGAALAWGIPLGIGGAAFISGANGITQQHSPADMRGRLLALTAVAFLGSTPDRRPDHRARRRPRRRRVGAGLRQRHRPGHRDGRVGRAGHRRGRSLSPWRSESWPLCGVVSTR